jgi:hypothetical protein
VKNKGKEKEKGKGKGKGEWRGQSMDDGYGIPPGKGVSI